MVEVSSFSCSGDKIENLGDDTSLRLRTLTKAKAKACRAGIVSKEDFFAAALRAHQVAVDSTESPHRELAEASRQKAEAARTAMQKKRYLLACLKLKQRGIRSLDKILIE